jgi:hypothetical protein
MIYERVTLLRRNDPSHEFREITLSHGAPFLPPSGSWSVTQQVGFLSRSDSVERRELFHGREQGSRQFFEEEIERLCKDGFHKCQPKPVPAEPMRISGGDPPTNVGRS